MEISFELVVTMKARYNERFSRSFEIRYTKISIVAAYCLYFNSNLMFGSLIGLFERSRDVAAILTPERSRDWPRFRRLRNHVTGCDFDA